MMMMMMMMTMMTRMTTMMMMMTMMTTTMRRRRGRRRFHVMSCEFIMWSMSQFSTSKHCIKGMAWHGHFQNASSHQHDQKLWLCFLSLFTSISQVARHLIRPDNALIASHSEITNSQIPPVPCRPEIQVTVKEAQ